MMIDHDLFKAISASRPDGADAFAYATSAVTGPDTGPTTAGEMLAALRRARDLLDANEQENRRRVMADLAGGMFNPFGGIRFIENTVPALTTQTKPFMAHKKRRNQTEAYHRRIQKKWVKRWGTIETPVVLQVDGGAFGMGSIFVVPPFLVEHLRKVATVTGRHVFVPMMSHGTDIGQNQDSAVPHNPAP